MLVLSRKLGESIRIGEQIEVKIVGIEGDQVKLGISAPRAVTILRKEIYEDIQRENSQAAAALNSELITAIQSIKRNVAKKQHDK
ncbi:MAG: carbon storage regulator CsrA [Sporolactobacillus sp.]